MNWSSLIGHERIAQWFETAIRKGRMGGSFLFVGQPGVGKRTTANLLAQTLLCDKHPPSDMNPCGVCEGCVQVVANSHPDVTRVRKPDDKSTIPLELLIGPPESRMQEGFCRDVRLRPMRGHKRVAIIEDADFLNEEGANCLLKTLEEPPSSSVILLIGTSEQKQLPTIRSRCRVIRFQSPRGKDAAKLMRNVHTVEASDEQIAEAVEIAGGDMHVTLRLLSGEADKLRDSLRNQFGSVNPDPVSLTRMINAHVEQSGKDASKRRAAMRDIFSLAVQHYRQQLRNDYGDRVRAAHILNRLDRSIRALREVDRSANQATLIECFAVDIASATTGDRGEIG